MGRLSKYKKIKACDPYSKRNGGNVDLSKVGIWGLGENGRKAKKRSKTAQRLRVKRKRAPQSQEDAFDLPPSGKEDEFDMKDLMGSIKKQKLPKVHLTRDDIDDPSQGGASSALTAIQHVKIPVNGNVATLPKTQQDEKREERILRTQTVKDDHAKYERREGESKRAYAKRTKSESRNIMKRSQMNPAKLEKKKEFLKQKKKKGKRAKMEQSDIDPEEDEFESRRRARAAEAAEPVFGEQAQRPPVFRQLPRGADKKKSERKSHKGTDNEQRTRELDAMRERVQAQYAAIKMKRRQAGDFHL